MTESRLSLNAIESLALDCLTANGCDDANAGAVARTMTAAERDGSASHGLFRMPGYVAALRSGKVDGRASPTITRIAPGILQVNANGGFAPLALEAGREPLIETTREQGVVVMPVIRCHHFAALWVEIEPLASAGLAAFACTAYMPAMPPAGGGTPFFGTNPLAFGWPRGAKPPMVFDLATAAKARGEIAVAARDGEPVPKGTGLDADGRPTTDPQAILDGGVLLPFGGYKGSNIAMMVELLCAGLIGERFSYEAAEHDNKDGGPPRGGEFLLAMDPARIAGDGWLDHSEDFFARMTGIDGVRLAGTRRYEARGRSEAEGVDIPDDLLDKISRLTSETG